ncbi:Hypothetical predicted protein [Lynx pardinus]|uniref:Uncharacterized protein n=1 Tax=Lynx pardinus TaxID=191816 RepID=A0A485PAG2_LYNPA|nr:Hypothetical predicted protein [Lynx pardinus]
MPSLPASCLLTQEAITRSNVKMKHVPALTDPGLAMLHLAEHEMARIPSRTFPGLPNLRRLDLSQNKLDARGLHPCAFKNLTRLKLDGNSLCTVPALQQLSECEGGPWGQGLTKPGLGRGAGGGLSRLPTLEVEGKQPQDGNISSLAFQPLHSLLYPGLDRNCLRTILPGLPASLQELYLGTSVVKEATEGMLNHSLGVLVLREDLLAPRAWIDLPRVLPPDLALCELYPDGHADAREGGLTRKDPESHKEGWLHCFRAWSQTSAPEFHLCDTPVAQDSNLIPTHLENSLIDRRRILPTAFSCMEPQGFRMLRLQPPGTLEEGSEEGRTDRGAMRRGRQG